MRRRAMAMTLSTVAVAVLLLGIPALTAGSFMLWNNAQTDIHRDAGRLINIIDRRVDSRQSMPTEIIAEIISTSENTDYILVEYGKNKLSEGLYPTGPAISYSLTGTTGAKVTILTSRSTVTVRIVKFLLIGVSAILISFLVAVAVALRQSRKISVPLIYLAAAAEQIGAGQTSPRVRTSGIEEIDLVYEELVRTAERTAGRIAAERQFAADASHQLRTPLTALSMRLEEIEYLSDQPEVREEAASCLEQVERLTGVVSDLLSSSRSVASNTEAVPVARQFEQQREEWERPFARSGRGLEFSDASGIAVLCSPGSLAQIIATLIENSLKYGGGTTRVSARTVGKGVVIDVADEGTGIPDELREAIFTTGVSTGNSTGIGLPLARRLAEAAGGRLELAQARPPIFRVVLNEVPKTINVDNILPAGAMLSIGSRRRRR